MRFEESWLRFEPGVVYENLVGKAGLSEGQLSRWVRENRSKDQEGGGEKSKETEEGDAKRKPGKRKPDVGKEMEVEVDGINETDHLLTPSRLTSKNSPVKSPFKTPIKAKDSAEASVTPFRPQRLAAVTGASKLQESIDDLNDFQQEVEARGGEGSSHKKKRSYDHDEEDVERKSKDESRQSKKLKADPTPQPKRKEKEKKQEEEEVSTDDELLNMKKSERAKHSKGETEKSAVVKTSIDAKEATKVEKKSRVAQQSSKVVSPGETSSSAHKNTTNQKKDVEKSAFDGKKIYVSCSTTIKQEIEENEAMKKVRNSFRPGNMRSHLMDRG
jgi:hypothetical protein